MTPLLEVTLIAIHSRDGFISQGSGVPWQLPADKAHFRSNTRGKWLLLGRKTYQEMLGWFSPEQQPLVLSHSLTAVIGPGQLVRDLPHALQLAQQSQAKELVVCGGGQCYAAAMPYATQLLLTEVDDLLYEGIPFPCWKANDWQLCAETELLKDELHAYAMKIRSYRRKA
jgi:dihydrofolate reductase